MQPGLFKERTREILNKYNREHRDNVIASLQIRSVVNAAGEVL
jgi:hypothetical protein